MKVTKLFYIGLSVLILGFSACELQSADTAETVTTVKEETKKEEKKEEEQKKEEEKKEEEKKEEQKKEEEQKKPEEQTKQEEQKKTDTPASFGWEKFSYDSEKSNYTNYTITEENGDTATYSISQDNKTITLLGKANGQSPTKYIIKGLFEGQIINELKDNELVLDGAYLVNTNVPPVLGNKKLYVTAKDGTTSYVVAKGTNTEKYGAIHCNKGLELGGKGTCYIAGEIYHGIKASNIELKGSGTFYIQGAAKGAAINCNNLDVKESKSFTAYLINAKNGIKADEKVTISSGTFYFGNVETAIKTDLSKDDAADNPKTHSITLKGGTFNYNKDDVKAFYSTDENKYIKENSAVINELSNTKTK